MADSDSTSSDSTSQSLYERVGGEEAIREMVVEFYVKVLADPLLAPFFKDSELEPLHLMQREFFSAALGGPINYTGRPLHSVHAGRGIRPEHMKRFVGHMLDTLDVYSFTEGERNEVISRINTYADEIMGGGYGAGG